MPGFIPCVNAHFINLDKLNFNAGKVKHDNEIFVYLFYIVF